MPTVALSFAILFPLLSALIPFFAMPQTSTIRPAATDFSLSDLIAPHLDAALHDALVAWRRHVHKHPELSFQEFETAAYIERELRAMGYDDITSPTPTSRVATLVGRAGPGRTIALRADIDALPVEEAEGLSFRSVNPGVSHVCGHDNHVAILLGTAKVLLALADRIPGRVNFFFQHAEESAPGGAPGMVAAGVLDGVDACVGLHVMNDPIGLVRVTTVPAVTTACDGVRITIRGRGTHGSMPHAGIDPILVGAEMVLAFQTIVARNIAPDHFAVVSPTIFHGGNAINVIPDTAEIGVNFRTKDENDRRLIYDRIVTIARNVAAAHGAEIDLLREPGCAATIQDPAMIERALRVAYEVMPEGKVATGSGMTGSEDFSAFAERVPSVYLILGGGTAQEGYPYQNHHPAFRADEACLKEGVRIETALALDYLLRP